ncbi:MAG: hypothetical protein HWE18_04600 [Gammaproteobacteria bacterium]|nr:hypothetical protein [Gammaproteobacteria bacterium]
MYLFKQKLLWVSAASLALTACGGSSSSSSSSEEEHDISILVSQSNTTSLSLLEEGALETLDEAAAGNGAKLVLSENGAFAAVLANGTVNFVHGLHEEEEGEEAHEEDEHEEAHVLTHNLTGTDIAVVPSNGHFAVLVDGDTTFIEYAELENETPATEDTSGLSVDEVYPALMLDEAHDLKLVFDGTNAKVFEANTEEYSFACANPSSHGQTSELVVVSCDEGAVSLLIEEGETEHVITSEVLADLDGVDEDYIWRAQGHVIAGFVPNSTDYAIVEHDETNGILVVKGSDDGTNVFSENICDLQLDTTDGDVLTLTAGGKFVALDHEGAVLKTIALDESAQTSCGDLVLASASKAVVVIDNNVLKGYGIDVDEPETNPAGYHVHERFDLNVSDIASMVIFHEVGETHDHAH